LCIFGMLKCNPDFNDKGKLNNQSSFKSFSLPLCGMNFSRKA